MRYFFTGLWCCLGHANEILPPDVLVVLNESDNSVSNDFNSVLYPVEKYYSHIHNVQFWNKYFDNLQKKINVFGHFLRNVEIPINFSPHMIKRYKKSIVPRKPRSADVTTDSSINHSQSSLSSGSALPNELNTNINQSEIITTTTVSTSTKSNMMDIESSANSTVVNHPTDSTTLNITSNPKLVETTTLIQQKIPNTSNDNSIAIEKTDTSSSERKFLVLSLSYWL